MISAIRCIETDEYFPNYTEAARQKFGNKNIRNVTYVIKSGQPFNNLNFEKVKKKTKKHDPCCVYKSNLTSLSLCEFCQNTNMYLCSWFNPDEQKPVEGWEATIKKSVFRKDDNGKKIYGVIVKKCPNFKKEEWCVMEENYTDAEICNLFRIGKRNYKSVFILSELTGYTEAKIKKILEKNNLEVVNAEYVGWVEKERKEPKTKGILTDINRQICEMRFNGMEFSDIGKEFKMSYQQVYKRYERWNNHKDLAGLHK